MDAAGWGAEGREGGHCHASTHAPLQPQQHLPLAFIHLPDAVIYTAPSLCDGHD